MITISPTLPKSQLSLKPLLFFVTETLKEDKMKAQSLPTLVKDYVTFLAAASKMDQFQFPSFDACAM